MKTLLALSLALVALFATPAHAETDGAAGLVSTMMFVNASSSSYASYHGYVVIGTAYFYWGGTTCTGVIEPSSADLDRLLRARVEGIQVNPWYVPVTTGTRTYNCLAIYQTY